MDVVGLNQEQIQRLKLKLEAMRDFIKSVDGFETAGEILINVGIVQRSFDAVLGAVNVAQAQSGSSHKAVAQKDYHASAIGHASAVGSSL